MDLGFPEAPDRRPGPPSAARPRVSVVLANYNGEAYLAEALQAVLRQTIDDLEVLFVDDASTDGSVALAEAIAAGDPRLPEFAPGRPHH